jgi:hypothetical protein
MSLICSIKIYIFTFKSKAINVIRYKNGNPLFSSLPAVTLWRATRTSMETWITWSRRVAMSSSSADLLPPIHADQRDCTEHPVLTAVCNCTTRLAHGAWLKYTARKPSMSLARARSPGGWRFYSNREIFVDISKRSTVPLSVMPTILFNLIQNILYFRYSYFGRGGGGGGA